MADAADVLERKLAARDKTIAALMRRVEGATVSNNSAFSTFEENIRLEQVVARKTEELKAAQERLLREMEVQRALEVELRQAQKLEAVGRLAAGVAHEINTPVQYVSDSLSFVREALADLSGYIAKARELSAAVVADDPANAAAQSCEALAEESDLDYLLENLGPAVDRALGGLERVANIVRALKRFAHPGSAQMAPADLNEAIASTLTIAANEYKYVAELVTDYAELPLVTCHLGDLNQAVLNLVVNAAHAIADVVAGSGARGTISVRTRHDGDHVQVEIADTGGGIPDEIRERIFEPFFTTKEVGRGTGQGLAIARNVIHDDHGGELSFVSERGVGTTFRIRLPVTPLRPR
ncbi:MAG: ATP-binding protein [Myxococcales bacterium]|nr:ATP-binding protein [Myxococcales bacterium]